MLIAKAWAKALREGGDPADLVGGDLLKAIRSVDYVNGVTGNVTLDATGNVRAREFSMFQFIGPNDTWTVSSTCGRAGGCRGTDGSRAVHRVLRQRAEPAAHVGGGAPAGGRGLGGRAVRLRLGAGSAAAGRGRPVRGEHPGGGGHCQPRLFAPFHDVGSLALPGRLTAAADTDNPRQPAASSPFGTAICTGSR